MRIILLMVAVLFSSLGSAEVQEISKTIDVSEKESFVKNINKGNIEVGGGGSLGYSSFSGVLVSASASARYFLWNKFSLGGGVGFNHNSNFTGWSIGPSAAYYFWEAERWAGYLRQDIRYNQNRFKNTLNGNFVYGNRSVENRIDGVTSIGAKYFLTSSVALDIRITQSYLLSTDANAGSIGADTQSILGFSISL